MLFALFLLFAGALFIGATYYKSGKPTCPSGTELVTNNRSYTCESKVGDGTKYDYYFSDEAKKLKSCNFEWHGNKMNGLQRCWYTNGKPFISIQARENRAESMIMWRLDGSEWLVLKRHSPADLSFDVVKYDEPDRLIRDIGAQSFVVKYLADPEDKSKEKINYFNLLVDSEAFSKDP